MDRGDILLLLLILWSIVPDATTISVSTQRPNCNQTVSTLSSLREITASVNDSETMRLTDYVICVNLRPGNTTEQIGYSSTVIDSVSVIITGTTGSVVKCETPPSGRLPLSDYTQFPLMFTNSSLVIIEGVQFEGCMRPLKFKWVTRVEFVSSSFR